MHLKHLLLSSDKAPHVTMMHILLASFVANNIATADPSSEPVLQSAADLQILAAIIPVQLHNPVKQGLPASTTHQSEPSSPSTLGCVPGATSEQRRDICTARHQHLREPIITTPVKHAGIVMHTMGVGKQETAQMQQ